MLFVIEVVVELEEVFVIEAFTVGVDEAQELDLIDRLVEVVLVILDDLHADHLLSVDVVALNGLRECSRTQILNHLVAAGDDRVNDYWEILGLFEAGLLSVEDNSKVVAVVDDAVELCRIEVVVGDGELDPTREDTGFAAVFLFLYPFLSNFTRQLLLNTLPLLVRRRGLGGHLLE